MQESRFVSNNGTKLAGSFYFLYFAAAASLIPFLVLQYDQLALSGSEIGFLVGISPLVVLFSAPFWGAAADTIGKHRLILMLAIGGTILLAAVLSGTTQFIALSTVIIIFSFFTAPIIPLVDNSVMDLLGSRKDQYGKLRLWGAVGWGLVAPIIGILTDRSGLKWIFWGFIVFMFLALLVSFRLPISEWRGSLRFGHGVRQLVTNRQWLLFLTVVFVGGACMTLIGAYLFLHMQTLGGDKAMMGLALTIGTISEIPIFYYSDRLLKRWGARGLLALSLAAFGIRGLALSLIQVAWLVLPLQLLHGPSFSALWAAGVSYADELAPPGLGATAQGTFAGVLLGLGSAFGGFLGGLMIAEFGSSIMYRWMFMVVVFALILFILAERRMLTIRSTQEELKS